MALGFLALAAVIFVPALFASSSAWTDTEGTSFKAEPSESLGPLALFRSRFGAGRMVAWRFLPPDECLRFFHEIQHQAGRAGDWTAARGSFSRELAGHVLRLNGGKLVAPDLAGRPEPEFYIIFLANSGVGKSWDMIGHSVEPFQKLRASFPGVVEGVFFGLQHSANDHVEMAKSMNMPWLVTDYSEQYLLPTIIDLAPMGDREAYGIVVVTWDGVPVFSASSPDDDGVKQVFGKLGALLELMRPGNPRSWPDRAHYLRAIQPELHATDRADPQLVGNPLIPEGLRERKITRVDATFAVAADGSVTTVTIRPDTGVPANMIVPLADALKKACVMVPAVDHGRFVEGRYHYLMSVP
jgi:hypothetical protein